MCFYIALVVRGGDAASIDQVLRKHGRQAKPIANASVARALAPGEAQFLTTVGHCDCGTALAPLTVDRASKRTAQAAKLSKKGWSQAKIERWLKDSVKADAKAEERRHASTPDSVELWSRVVGDLMSTPGVQQAGLLLHFYSGDIDNEDIEATRETVPLGEFEAHLRGLREDQLLMAA
jgi:ribosomal protein S16